MLFGPNAEKNSQGNLTALRCRNWVLVHGIIVTALSKQNETTTKQQPTNNHPPPNLPYLFIFGNVSTLY
jgi:hypothetical protein